MALSTSTGTQVITRTKLALAVAFLGVSMAASAAAGVGGMKQPDLTIKKVTYQSDFNQGKLTVYYQNIGNAAVTVPFNILVKSSPKVKFYKNIPFVGWGEIPEYGKVGSGIYTVPVDTFALQPKDFGMVELWIPNFLPGTKPSKLSINLFVDREAKTGESNQKNNSAVYNIPKVRLVEAPLVVPAPEPEYGYGYGNTLPTGGYGYGYGYNAAGNYVYGYGYGYGYKQ